MQALRAQSGTLALLGRAVALLAARVSPVFGDAQCQALRCIFDFCFYEVQEIKLHDGQGVHTLSRGSVSAAGCLSIGKKAARR